MNRPVLLKEKKIKFIIKQNSIPGCIQETHLKQWFKRATNKSGPTCTKQMAIIVRRQSFHFWCQNRLSPKGWNKTKDTVSKVKMIQ